MTQRSRPGRRAGGRGKGEGGVTLTELLVATFLLAMTVGAIGPLLTVGLQSGDEGDHRLEMLQNDRLALDKLVREMRAAVSFSVVSPTLLRFSIFYGEENVRSNPAGVYPPWWNASWTTRKGIAVTTGSAAAPTGYSLPLTFDHAALVAGGGSQASGNDVRVLYWNGAAWVELDRVLEPGSGWNKAATRIWFKTQAAISANGHDNNYYLYYGNPAATGPPASENNVFHFADFFNRADADVVGGGWTVTESTGDVDILSNALVFNTTGNLNNRPLADHTFAAITDRLVWRSGFTWARTGADLTYRVHLQLGNSAAMANPPTETNFFSNAGVGPSLLWAGPDQGMTNHQGFGTAVGITVTERQVVSAAAKIEVIVNVTANTYDLYINDVLKASGVAFSSAQASIDQVRFLTWQVTEADFSSRLFDYTYIRKHVTPEPAASLVEILTVEYQLNAATNELEYRVLPDAFQRLAGPFRSLAVTCFDQAGAALDCASVALVRSVQVQLVAMDPQGLVEDLTVTSRALRRAP